MKSIFTPMIMQNDAKRLFFSLAIAVAMMFVHQKAKATVPAVDLGTASSFAVLGGSGVANAGATTITGDVGSFPTATIAGFGTVTLNGTNYGGDPVTQNAQNIWPLHTPTPLGVHRPPFTAQSLTSAD